MKQTTGCLKKTGFLDMTKKRTLVGIFKGVGLNSTCRGRYFLSLTVACCFLIGSFNYLPVSLLE